jgi:gluconokinase
VNITNRLSDQTLIVVIGPSGCGKSTLAHKISQELNIKFLEGDDFHPQLGHTLVSS